MGLVPLTTLVWRICWLICDGDDDDDDDNQVLLGCCFSYLDYRALYIHVIILGSRFVRFRVEDLFFL